jgi:hypothetical protein
MNDKIQEAVDMLLQTINADHLDLSDLKYAAIAAYRAVKEENRNGP